MFTRGLIFDLTPDTIKVQMFSLHNPGNILNTSAHCIHSKGVGYPHLKTQFIDCYSPLRRVYQVIKLRYFSENFVFDTGVRLAVGRYKT